MYKSTCTNLLEYILVASKDVCHCGMLLKICHHECISILCYKRAALSTYKNGKFQAGYSPARSKGRALSRYAKDPCSIPGLAIFPSVRCTLLSK